MAGRRSSSLILFAACAPLVAACEMDPAEVLDEPRVLALQTVPAELAPGEPHVLTALAFAVDGEIAWSLCPEAWRPTDPLSCPSGDAVDLGRGNPLTATLPADLTSAWLRAEVVDGSALPAVKLVEADSGAANPGVVGLRTPDGPLPATLARGAELALLPELDAATDASQVVVSWYVTAGELEPARTLGDEPATLVVGAAGPVDVIGVVRSATGGTAWVEARLEVTP